MDNRKRFSISLIAILCLLCALSGRSFAMDDEDEQVFLSADKAFILQVTPIKDSDTPQSQIKI